MKKTVPALIAILLLLAIAPPTQAQTEPRVRSNTATLDFPNRISFTLDVDSSAEIVEAELAFDVAKFSCVDAAASVPVELDGTRLSYDLVLTRVGNLPPGSEVWWEWTLTDASGNTVTTPRETLTIEDDRFEWQVVSAEGVHMHWHEGRTVGPVLLDAAVDGLDRLEAEMGIELQDDVDIYIYNSSEEMRDALLFVQGWAGGVAFSEFNTILLGVAPDEVSDWGVRVVAHELAHLVVGQFGRSCTGGSRPTWLDEGLAMVAEGEPEVSTLADIERGIEEGAFDPLRSLNGAFSAHFSGALSAYSQSYSVVQFLLDTYGQEQMQTLLHVLAEGEDYDESLERVYGFNLDGLEVEWRQALDAPPRVIPPTPTPIRPNQVPTIPPLAVADVMPTPAVIPTLESAENARPRSGLCGLGLAPLAIIVGWSIKRRREETA